MIASHLQFFPSLVPVVLFLRPEGSCGTRENVSTAGCNSRPFTLHQENGQDRLWSYCGSLPSPVLLRPGTGLHGSGPGTRVRGCGADRLYMPSATSRLYGCESLVLGSRLLVPSSA